MNALRRRYVVDFLSTHGFSSIGLFGVLSRVLKRRRYDIIYSHQDSALWCGIFTFFHGNYRLVFDCHGNPLEESKCNPFISPLNRTLNPYLRGHLPMYLSDAIVTPSMELYEHYRRKKFITFVPNGIDPSEFYPEKKSDEIAHLIKLQGKTVIAFTCPRNFYANLIAFNLLAKTAKLLPSVAFLIFGGGPIIPAPQNIIFLDYVEDLRRYINFADVCIMPYANIGITCGGSRNKLLEYWACAKPTISTLEGVRGIPEARNNEHFYLVDDNPKAIASGIVDLINDQSLMSKLSENCFSLVKRKYTWDRQAEKVESVIRRLVDK